MSQREAVCLVSGGLDSATCLAIAKSEGFDCYALTFDYGQPSAASDGPHIVYQSNGANSSRRGGSAGRDPAPWRAMATQGSAPRDRSQPLS